MLGKQAFYKNINRFTINFVSTDICKTFCVDLGFKWNRYIG